MTDQLADEIERLREQAWRRSGAPKMDAGHTKMLEWEAADEIERLRGLLGDAGEEIERLRGLLADAADLRMVYCVLCVDDGAPDRVHIFTTQERAEAWASTDKRYHIMYDYLLDHPERMEQASS